LACAAGISVLDVIKKEHLIENVNEIYNYFLEQITKIPKVKKMKGRGLMLGLEFDFEVGELRKQLIFDKHIFTGGSNNKKLLRILPPLSITKTQINQFINALKELLNE